MSFLETKKKFNILTTKRQCFRSADFEPTLSFHLSKLTDLDSCLNIWSTIFSPKYTISKLVATQFNFLVTVLLSMV